jgi:hypothetical protein
VATEPHRRDSGWPPWNVPAWKPEPWTLKGSLKMNSCWVVELFCLPKAGAYQEVAESLLSMLLRCKKQEKMDKKHRH